jgi:hypothetical protein
MVPLDRSAWLHAVGTGRVAALVAVVSTGACGGFLFSSETVDTIELEGLRIEWASTDSVVTTGDSLLVEVRVLNKQGDDVTSLVQISWNALPTTVCALSQGVHLGPSARIVHGVAAGQATVSVRARGLRSNDEIARSPRSTRTFVVGP